MRANRLSGAQLAALACLVMLMAMAVPAAALGIRPSQTSLDFQPGLSGGHSFTIVNSGSSPLNVSLATEGELADYITLGQDSVSLQPGEEKAVAFTISLPQSLEPGTREGYIRATEQPDAACQSCTSAVVSLLHRVQASVPYPGKYLEGGIEINENPDRVYLSVRVKNMGQEDVSSASAEFILSDYSGDVLRLETGPASMSSLEEKELVASFSPGEIEPGLYSLSTKVSYDSSSLSIQDSFKFGMPGIELAGHGDSVQQGGIQPLPVRLKSMWNEPLSGAASVSLAGIEGPASEPVPFELGPREEKQINVYVDTEGLAASTYSATLTLAFGGGTQEASFDVAIGEQALQTPQDWLLSAVIIVLAVLAAALALFALKR